MKQRVADFLHRQIASRIQNDGIFIAEIAEIDFAADHRFDIHHKGARAGRLQEFPQVRGRGQYQLRHRFVQPFDLAFVLGLDLPPEPVNLGFAVEIREHLVKSFDGQNVGRQIVVRKTVGELRRRANYQRKRDVAGERGRRIGQFVFAVILPEGLGRGALQTQ